MSAEMNAFTGEKEEVLNGYGLLAIKISNKGIR
jgi:hypothetical protein